MRSDRCPATVHPEKPQDGLDEHAHQQEIARGAQDRRAVGEDESAKDIARRLLRQPQQRRQRDLLGLALEHFEHRHAFDAVFGDHLLEDRGFEDAEPDPQPDPDHDDADQKRDAPAPHQELVARKPAEHQHRQIGQEEPGRRAELRPGRDEAAMLGGSRPFHGQQYRAAPFAADADPLDQANDRQQDRAPDADARVGRDETDGNRRDAGHQQGRNQGRLAPDPIAPMAEYRRADRPPDKPDKENAERLENADQGSGLGEEERSEDQRAHLAVKQEIIPFDRGADRAGDQCAVQLRAMLDV